MATTPKNQQVPNPVTPLFAACKQAFIDAMSYQPSGGPTLTPSQVSAKQSTIDTMSTIFANDMVIAFQDALQAQTTSLPTATFDLKDSTGASVTGTITIVAPQQKTGG